MKYTEYQDLLPSEILENVQNIHAELSTMGFTEEIKEAKRPCFIVHEGQESSSQLCLQEKRHQGAALCLWDINMERYNELVILS